MFKELVIWVACQQIYQVIRRYSIQKFRRSLKACGRLELPNKAGLTIPEILDAAEKGDIKFIYIMGENPMVSDPDINHVRKALSNLDFLVVQDIFLTETAELADVVLPAASFAKRTEPLLIRKEGFKGLERP